MKRTFLSVILVFLAAFAARTASAATLSVSADPASVAVGGTVDLTVTIDTEGVAVNAAQATLQFPGDLLEVSSVDAADSIFNFWVDGPSFSNETGRITFLGGSTNGFNGSSLRVVRIHAKMKAEGTAQIGFVDGSVAANDGSGTNVLASMHGTSVTASGAPVAETPPKQIVREPTRAEKVPPAPALEIPLYPDPASWYNTLAPFFVRWVLPSDISGVSTELNQIPKFDPKVSEGLFDNKILRVPGDGIWYLHVRFRNNVGWGETASVRLAVDTIPPTAFQTAVDPALVTDVPSPVISFESADQLSGLQGYSIQVDGEQTVKTAETTYALPALAPGNHVVNVNAIDQAGNTTNTSVEITTLPIEAPTVSPITEDAYAGEGGLDVGGTAAQGQRLTVDLRRQSGELVGTSLAVPDQNGVWTARFEQPLKEGDYVVTVTASDERGATSLPVTAALHVIPRPFLTLGGVEISRVWFFSVVFAVLLLGYVFGWEVQKRQKKKRGWHVMIAQRDVGSAFEQIETELESMVERHEGKVLGEQNAQEMLMVTRRVLERIRRVKQYILDNIEEINV